MKRKANDNSANVEAKKAKSPAKIKHKDGKAESKQKIQKENKPKEKSNDKLDKKPKDPKDKKDQRLAQKKLKSERKAKDSTVFELGTQAKKVWETVRSQACPKDEKERLIPELHELVKGQILKIIHAHDTVRVVEFLMAEGGPEIRQQLFDELKEELIGLAKSKYANFFVQKMLNYGTKEQKDQIIKAFEGRVAELTKHKVANSVIETCFNDVANAPQRNRFLQEFFGPEFRLWKQEQLRTVLEVVEKHPEKEKGITLALGEHVQVLITKGCYNQSLVHTVIYNYVQLLNHQIKKKQEVKEGLDFKTRAEKSRTELITHLRDVCVHILHSHDGSRVAMNALWHGNAKDRKSIIKSFKTFVPKIVGEEQGHMVLLAAFDCVDDTKLIGNAVVGEITHKMEELMASDSGRKVLMYLCVGRDKTYFHPDYLAVLEQGDGNEFTKKDEDIRRKELAAAVQKPLCKYLVENLDAILPSGKLGSITIFLQAVLNSRLENAKDVHEKLAELAAKPFKPGTDNLMEDSAFHRLMKKLISHDKDRQQDFAFSTLLLDQIKQQGSLESLIRCNRGAFVLVAILESEVSDSVENLKKLLKKAEYSKIMKQSKSKGTEILMKKIA